VAAKIEALTDFPLFSFDCDIAKATVQTRAPLAFSRHYPKYDTGVLQVFRGWRGLRP